MNRKFNWVYIICGILLFLGWGWLFLQRAMILEMFQVDWNYKELQSFAFFLGLMSLGSLAYVKTGFQYPQIKNYPVLLFFFGQIIAFVAVGIGYFKVPQAVADGGDLESMLIPLIAMGGVSVLCFLISTAFFPVELKKAKRAKSHQII